MKNTIYSISDVDEMIKYMNTHEPEFMVALIGEEVLIAHDRKQNGPINTWKETYGFNDGYYESFEEYKEDYTDSELIDIVCDSEFEDYWETFYFSLDSLEQNKEFYKKLLENDKECEKLFNNRQDPISLDCQKNNCDMDIVDSILELLFC